MYYALCSLQDGARLARRVQEAALAAAASGEGLDEDLQQRVEAAVANEVNDVTITKLSRGAFRVPVPCVLCDGMGGW